MRPPTPAPILGHILKTLKPASRSRQRVQSKRVFRPVATTPRARSRTPRPSSTPAPTPSTVHHLKSADWSVTPFERFDSFLDTRKSVKDEWYPWGSGASSDSDGHTVSDHLTPPNARGSSRRNYSNDKTSTKKYDNTTVKPILNLNNLDKTAVREICQTTRMKDVKYLCKQYSLNSKSKKVQRLKRLKTKKLKTQKKPPKILPKKDTSKIKQIKRKRQHSLGARRHLYFEADSFRPRRSEVSLLDSLTSLLWPGSLVRAPVTLTAASEVKQPSPGRRSGHSLAPARGWLQGVLDTYSLVS